MLQWEVLVVCSWGKGYMICSSDALRVTGRGFLWDDHQCLTGWGVRESDTAEGGFFRYDHNDFVCGAQGFQGIGRTNDGNLTKS